MQNNRTPINSSRNDRNGEYINNNGSGQDIYSGTQHDTDYGDNYSDSPARLVKTKKLKTPKTPKNTGNKRARPPKSKPMLVLKIILWVLISIVLLLIIYLVLILFRINYTSDTPDSEYVSSITGELKESGDVENILLFGIDNHNDDENGRSDSMILLSIDKSSNEIKQTSFLRDTFLEIPGYGEDKLNAAYSYGGAKLAAETIEYNYRIKIDKYIIIDYSAFTSIVDAMGGVDIDLEDEEIDYINWQSWKNNQVETRYELDIDSYEFDYNDDDEYVASVHLNGRQALWHARNRGEDGICSGDDIIRAKRQREVIQAIFSKLKSSGPVTLMRVMWDAAPMLTTNMSKLDILGKIFSLAGYLGYERTEYRTPRGDNFYNDWEYDSAVLKIDDYDYEREELYSYIYGSSSDE